MERKIYCELDAEKLCEKMTMAVSLLKEMNYRLERQDMYEEMQMAREQARCCYFVLAQAQNALELQRYDEGNIKPVDFNISNLVQDLISDAGVRTRAKGCEITFETDIERGVICHADPDRFAACFMNLIVNSLQNVDFEEGTVRVVLKTYANAGSAAISVLDDGYSMTPSDLDEKLRHVGTHGFDVLRKFCESVGTEPNIVAKENDGFGVTIKVPLASPNPNAIFESNERGAGIESFSPASLLLYKLDWTRIIL